MPGDRLVPRGTIAECLDCGRDRPLATSSLCWACYGRLRRRAAGVRDVPTAVCLRCTEDLHGLCWICETRKVAKGRNVCIRCYRASHQLQKYWSDHGMPLLFDAEPSKIRSKLRTTQPMRTIKRPA